MKNNCLKLSIFYDHIVSVHQQMSIHTKEAAFNVHKLGIDYVDLNSSYLKNAYDEVNKTLQFADLKIGCICHECDFGRDNDISDTKYLIDMANELNVKKILIIPGLISCNEMREPETEQMINCVKLVSEYADKKNIVVCLEVYDNSMSPLSGKGVLQFLERCDLVQCVFDTGNFSFWNEDEVSFFEKLKENIVHVHLKDRSIVRCNEEQQVSSVNGEQYYPSPVGYGVMKIEEILKRLQLNSYEGIYSIEHYGAANQFEYIDKSVSWIINHTLR